MSEPHKRASVQGCRAAVATLQCLCCPFAVSTLCAAAVQCLELGDAVKSLAQGKVWSWSWAVGGCEHGMVSSLWGANSTTVSSGQLFSIPGSFPLRVLSLQHRFCTILPVSAGEEKQASAKLYFLLRADTHKICLFRYWSLVLFLLQQEKICLFIIYSRKFTLQSCKGY